MEVYSYKKIKKDLDRDGGRFYAGPAPSGGSFTSDVWTSGIWHMVYDNKKKTKTPTERLVRSFYYCTECKDLIQLEQGAKGNSLLTRHPCYKAHLKKKQNLELLMEAQQKKKERKEKEKKKEDSSDDSNSDSESESSSDSDSDVDENSGKKIKNGPIRLEKSQASILARVFYKFRKICLLEYCNNENVDSQTFFEIMPKTWNPNEWLVFFSVVLMKDYGNGRFFLLKYIIFK